MTRLAILDANKTKAQNVIAGDPADFPDAIDVTGTSVSKNWLYDSGTGEFSPPPAPDTGPNYVIEALVDGAQEVTVTAGTEVSIGITARKDGSTTTDFDGNTHYVPVVDVDGSKAALLKLTIQDGTASAKFTPSTPGIYTANTGKVYPAITVATIPNAPVVIAE